MWKLSPTDRGNAIEAYLAKTDYADWGNIGATQGGYFPVIDFVDEASTKAVSLKTIDPNLTSYLDGKVNNKITDYLNDLNRAITSTGPDGVPKLMDKILDVRVPVGTSGMIDISSLTEIAEDMGITLIIKEF